MDLIQQIDQLLADIGDAEGFGEMFQIPEKAQEYAFNNASGEHLKGAMPDEGMAYSKYRYDLNFDSIGYLDRWLVELRSKIDEADGSALQALTFDFIWVLGAYASDVRGRGDRALGLQIFNEAFRIAKVWPSSWAFASLLRRLPAFVPSNRDLSMLSLLYAESVFRVSDRFQAAFTLTTLCTFRMRYQEWEALESHADEAILAADNLFSDNPESDLLRRVGYLHLLTAQLKLGKFKQLTGILDLIPQLPGVSGHDLVFAGLARAAMHWDMAELSLARRCFARELERVSVRFPDVGVLVLFHWAFMESDIGDPRRSQALVTKGVLDVDGDPIIRAALEGISKGTASFMGFADEIPTHFSMPAFTPPKLRLQKAA